MTKPLHNDKSCSFNQEQQQQQQQQRVSLLSSHTITETDIFCLFPGLLAPIVPKKEFLKQSGDWGLRLQTTLQQQNQLFPAMQRNPYHTLEV